MFLCYKKNAVFETIVALYDYVNDMISEVENTSDLDKKNAYIAILNELIMVIDNAARTISVEYSDIIKSNKINKNSSNKIKKSLDEIFDAVNKVKDLLYNI